MRKLSLNYACSNGTDLVDYAVHILCHGYNMFVVCLWCLWNVCGVCGMFVVFVECLWY